MAEIFADIGVVSTGSDRLSAIALNQGSSRILIVSVYLPSDNGSADQACAFDEQLAALNVMVHDTSYSSVMIMTSKQIYGWVFSVVLAIVLKH